MKKGLILWFFVCLFSFSLETKANDTIDPSVPYFTYTMGPNNQMIATQTAYQPGGYLTLPIALSRPEDMVLFNEQLFIVDSIEKKVFIFNDDLEFIDDFSYDGFVLPKGLDVDANYIYVADQGAEAVFIFDHYSLETNKNNSAIKFNNSKIPVSFATPQRDVNVQR